MPLYYVPSGKFDAQRTILATLVLLLLIPLLSFIYNMVSTFIPIIYFNVLIAIGYGFLLGYGLRFVANFGKVRNTYLLLGIGLLVALLAIFTYWKAFVAYVFADFTVSLSNYVSALLGTFLPISFWSAINEINLYGTWGIGLSAENTVNGAFLWVIWIVEMVIIGGIPLYLLWTREIHPYSEEQQTYYDRYTLERGFGSIYAARQTLEKLSTAPLATLAETPEGRAALYSMVSVYYLPGTKFGYLDVDQVSIGEKDKTEVSTIIDNLQINAADAKQILDTYPHVKAGLLD